MIRPISEIPSCLRPIWERSAPRRYDFEMHALTDVVGTSLRVDQEALAKGVLIVEFDWPLEGGPIPLRVTYPDSFPRLRPIVQLRGDRSTFPARHCSPIDGNLCLLGRDTRQWRQQWTLRKLLESQLQSALAGTGEEDHQGEPAEYWWNHYGLRESYCLVDTSWTLGSVSNGTLLLRYRLRKADQVGVQAIVTEIRDATGTAIQNWSGAIPAGLEAEKEIIIPWIFINDTILPDGTAQSVSNLMGRFPTIPRFTELGSVSANWFAVLYKMEVGFQTEGVGWLFPFLLGPKRVFRPAKPGKREQAPRVAVLPTYRAGEADLGIRVPAIEILRDKRIAVIGVGAVGAPVAVELARNGCCKLHLLDHDVVEPGNSIRWPLGTSAWGRRKTESLSAFIRREYPRTEVNEHPHAIGSFDSDRPEAGDESVFESILPDVDLVVDSTASYGVSTFLSDLCRRRGIPLVSLYASPPVEGGVVARFSPKSGCPTCLEFAYHAGTINRPPGFDSERGLQQPPGCAERTFTGASYDLQELSLQAVRLIVETLEASEGCEESVVQSLGLVIDGRRSPPIWRVDPLPRADECSCANPR